MNHRVRGSVPRLSSMLKCPKAGQEGGCAAKTPEQLQTGTLWNVKNCSISKCKAGHDRRSLLGFWVVFSSNDNEEGWEETHLPWSLRGTAFLCTVCICVCATSWWIPCHVVWSIHHLIETNHINVGDWIWITAWLAQKRRFVFYLLWPFSFPLHSFEYFIQFTDQSV